MADPIRTKDETHLIPEWQQTEEFLSFLKVKKTYDDLLASGINSEAEIEALENELREKHLALIHIRVNQYAAIDFTTQAGNRGRFIS